MINDVHGRAWVRLLLVFAFALSAVRAQALTLVFGPDVSPHLKQRLSTLISQTRDQRDITLAFGETEAGRALVTDNEIQRAESFVARSRGFTYVARGHGRGLSFAAYELLQQLGYRFYHPFEEQAPALLTTNAVEVVESPRWPVRGLHLHTQHQIELTTVLNGWGPRGPTDLPGFQKLLENWDQFCEWMIAHRQNTVEWVLLASKTTPNFNDSSERLARLKILVERAHVWGLTTGIDVGIVFEQQNMWRLLRTQNKMADVDDREIRSRVDWLMKAGFDFITAETGFQEFRSPDDRKSLHWMNTIVSETAKFGRFAQVKVHASSGQLTKHYEDPDQHGPLNFNFLPHYADAQLVALPHTVQIYGLDDPAPTYGNKDFSEIRRFISMEAGLRPVIYYPEAAYWCSYDVDVPLFLASYGERRVHDLRLIANDEDRGLLGRGAHRGARIQGQLLFSSGFEWGYWLNNLVAMHAAWNPHTEAADDSRAYQAVLTDALRSTDFVGLLADQAEAEDELLIRGRVNGHLPRHVEKLNGIAYLAGQETWDEINSFIADKFKKQELLTQPSRVGFQFRKKLTAQGVDYVEELRPLLKAMASKFTELADRADKMNRAIMLTAVEKAIAQELAQSMRMTALRSAQIFALYEAHAYKPLKKSKDWFDARADDARSAVDQAAMIVSKREKAYRVDRNLIASWSPNPTSYMYGYLWTAHSLMWWYRDEGSALKEGRKNVCFMNIVNPADNVFADGQKTTIYKVLKAFNTIPLFGALNECLTPKLTEPNPRERVRSRVPTEELASR